MKTIDARGLGCPKPVMLAEEAVAGIDDGTVMVLVDNEGAVRNLERFARNNALYAESEKADGHWKVRVVKGVSCEAPASTGKMPREAGKSLLIVISTDTLGRDEALGRILMKGFLETMRTTGELPHTIFLMNTAVRMSTTDEEMVPILQRLADMGVEIFSCGTCLKHYGLENSLRVGYRGTTNNVVEGFGDFAKTVWI